MQPVSIKASFFYEARIIFGMASLLPAMLLPAYALLGWIVWTMQEHHPDLSVIASACEQLLPLSAGLLAAHLMSIEREEDFDEIRRSYPESSWRIPLTRSLGAIVITLGAASLAALIFRFAYGDYPFPEVILPALPPAFYLLALALVVNNISGNAWIAGTAVVGYWFLDYFTVGQYTGVLYLFHATMPNPEIDYDLNRWSLVGVAMGLCLMNGFYSTWRRRKGG